MASKRVVQDIIPSGKKIIKLSKLISSNKKSSIKESVEKKYKDWDDEIPVIIKKKSQSKPKKELISFDDKINKNNSNSSKISKIITFGIVFLCIAIIAIALSLLYTKAIVTIVPNTIPINIDGNFIAKKDSSADSLNYQILSINLDDEMSVPATDGPLIQNKAKGTITLYNNFSTTTQKILAGTKISANNLNYKTTWSVVIPGKKLVNGKLIPGSVDVGIIAENAGEQYNLLLSDKSTDFNIVAYKGSSKYATISGKLKKDIIGGFLGKKKIISLDIEKNAYTELENRLKDKLLKNTSLAIPDNFVMFDNSYIIEYKKLPIITNDASSAKISIKGTLNAVIFNINSLTESIAKKQIDERRLLTYRTDGIKSLKFTLINDKDQPIKKGSPISFNLKGPIKITGIFSEKDLKNKLLGIKLDQMNSVIKQYPSIFNVSVRLTPFWMRSFPNSADNIIIEYK